MAFRRGLRATRAPARTSSPATAGQGDSQSVLPIDQTTAPADDTILDARSEQARLLAAKSMPGIVANLAAEIIAAGALLTTSLPPGLVIGWFIALLATLGYRWWAVSLYRRDMDAPECQAWLTIFASSTMLMGIAWGSLGWALFLHPGALPEALIVMILIGVAGAATANFGALFRGVVGFVIPALLPMTVHYLVHGTLVGWAMVLLATIYLLLLIHVARLRERTIFTTVAQAGQTRALAEQLRIIADYSHAWESWFSEDGRLLWVNPSVERVTGYSEVECYRMADFPMAIVHPEDRDTVAAVIRESRRLGNKGHCEARILRKDGVTRWTAAEWQPARDSRGALAGVRVSVRDITENVELREELEDQATTDPLTGLMNRRRFFDTCNTELYRAARFGRPVALAIFDLDHFKRVNDTHGHHVGDLCLKAFVSAIQANIRQTDALARFGGEEFTLLMPETDLAAAEQLCDRLRQAVGSMTVTTPDGPVQFTVSAGVTVCGRTANTIDPALTRADNALYAAKNKGRDRVRSLDPSRPEAGLAANPDATADLRAGAA